MARTRTLLQLRQDMADRADIVDGGTTGRHTTVNINRRINQAVQAFRRMVTEAGADTYITQAPFTCSTSSTVDAANWAPRDYIALPNDFYHLKGIDISLNGTTVPMLDFDMLERNIFRQIPSWLSNSGVGMPVMYKLGGYNAAGSAVVKIIPSADTAYQGVIWYLPIAPDLVNDSDTFDGIAGLEEWVVNRACMDTMLRDQASQPLYAALAAENAKLEADYTFQIASSGPPAHRIDSQALRNYLAQVTRGNFGFL